MRAKGELIAAGAVSVARKLLLVYRSVPRIFGTVEPAGGPYQVAFTSERSRWLPAGRRLLAFEGRRQRPTDSLHEGTGDDCLATVSYTVIWTDPAPAWTYPYRLLSSP
ncbi:MAG: hypothetical protein M3151_07285 [Actinomycetota bacterium]|nr:hypothetical protein [Actinomycetota bacterium]